VQALRDAASQLPAQGAVPPQAPRLPRGCPLVTAEHVPGAAGRSQASHFPLHSLLQQKPSTQWPLMQSPPTEQALPLGLAPHEPPTHGLGAAQGCDAPQVTLHATPAASQV
jgi:hypothetical protein